ncbi:MAG TPA: hypothetical protein VFB27_15085 [Opitutaceae bacterium]|nr:hypothetical protein [Opitutaceae bacterium]
MKILSLGVIALFATLSFAHAEETGPLVLAKTIPLPGVTGGFNHHSADGKNHRLFLCASTNKTVEVVNLDTGKVEQSLAGDKPAAICFAADEGLLCVSRGKTVQIYDARTFKSLASLPMPSSVDELHYDARTHQLLAGCMSSPNVGITPIDLTGPKVLAEIKSPKPQGFALEDGGHRVFVCTPSTDGVSVLDREKPAVVTAWKFEGAAGEYPAAYDATTHRLFVGCRRPAKLLVIDTDTGKTVAAVDIGRDTDDLSFDVTNRRVYVACGEGVTSVVQQDDADHYRNIATIATAPGGRNCGFVPETGEYFVTVPQQPGQEAKVLIYRAPLQKAP